MINDVLDIRLAVQRVPFLLTRLSASSRGWAKYTSPYQSKRWTQARTSPLPEQATAAGDHSEGCEGYGRQEGRERGARQQRDPVPHYVSKLGVIDPFRNARTWAFAALIQPGDVTSSQISRGLRRSQVS